MDVYVTNMLGSKPPQLFFFLGTKGRLTMAAVSYITPSKELQEVVPINLSLFSGQVRRFDEWGSDFHIVKEGDGTYRIRLKHLGGCFSGDPDKDELLTEIRDNKWSGIIELFHDKQYSDNNKIDYEWLALVFHNSELIAITQGPVVYWTKYKSWPIWKLRKHIRKTNTDGFCCAVKPERYARPKDFMTYPHGKPVVRHRMTNKPVTVTYCDSISPTMTKVMNGWLESLAH